MDRPDTSFEPRTEFGVLIPEGIPKMRCLLLSVLPLLFSCGCVTSHETLTHGDEKLRQPQGIVLPPGWPENTDETGGGRHWAAQGVKVFVLGNVSELISEAILQLDNNPNYLWNMYLLKSHAGAPQLIVKMENGRKSLFEIRTTSAIGGWTSFEKLINRVTLANNVYD